MAVARIGHGHLQRLAAAQGTHALGFLHIRRVILASDECASSRTGQIRRCQ
jgi:hypothetical protein